MSEPTEPTETPTEQQSAQTTEEHATNRPKQVIPEGMSKSQWKKQQRSIRFQERKAELQEVRKIKKQKARQNRREKIQAYIEKGEEVPPELLRKPRKAKDQTKTGATVIIDCDFDDLMTESERKSLSSQITRAYSSNRQALHTVDLKVTSFNKLLKKRFDEDLKDANHNNWPNVTFQEAEFKPEDPAKCIYLSADSDEVLNELDPSFTYVIGGIVDKGRYKNLCKDKAEKMGLKTARLPIEEFIRLSGRRVLTTTHVVELMLKWFEFKDWKQAFETVLPPRKILEPKKEGSVNAEQIEGTPEKTEEADKIGDAEEVEEPQEQVADKS